MMIYRLLFSALALGTSLHATAQSAPVASDNVEALFSPTQREAIGRIAADYLEKNPQFLVAASQKLEAQMREEQTTALNTAAMTNHEALLSDKTTPAYGPVDANVAVILFFDYQCIFCSRLAPVLKNVIDKSFNTRFLFKELPIFATRWPESAVAAQTGLTIWQQKGPDAYLAYHEGIFASGHNEGKLTNDDIARIASPIRPVEKATGETLRALTNNKVLAEALGITGTPAMVVMPTKNPQIKNITVFTGLTDEKSIMRAIRVARGENIDNKKKASMDKSTPLVNDF